MFPDEMDRDIGLLEAPLNHGHELAGDQRERLARDDVVSQLGQLAAQLVALRLKVGGGGGEENRLGVGGSIHRGVDRVAEVLEHLRNVVCDVVDALVKALQGEVSKRLVKFAQPSG